MSGDGIMLGAVRRRAARMLAGGVSPGETAALDARLLIAGVLGLDPGNLPLADYRTVSADEMQKIDACLARRRLGEPVARILGVREFWGLPIALTPATLVPRPDTETLVEAVLAYFDRRGGRERVLRLVDIGTGSGAILIALLSELPSVLGLGIDLSGDAVATARDNAERLGFGDRSLFVEGRWGDCCGMADVVVANPPYIRSEVIATLSVEVRDHDPRLALDGGPDGLDAYRAILADLDRLMAPDGAAFLEIGFDQAADVSAMVAGAGLIGVTHRDLGGRDRVVEISRH